MKNLLLIAFLLIGQLGFTQCNLDLNGSVLSHDGDAISEVNVKINTSNGNEYNLNNSVIDVTLTEPTDDFTFTYTIEKEIDVLNGVSTLDFVLMWRHILGITPFDEPWKPLAADIDDNGSVTVMDMVLIRRVILGQNSTFEFVPSWQFYDDQYGPHNYTVTVENCAVIGGGTIFDFIGVKMGDVNNSVTP